MSGDLVGPLPVVRFQDHTAIPYAPPRDTLDVRYRACTEHHPACDCREAEFAEELAEWRSADRDTRQAFDTILAGHATGGFGLPAKCQCHGCQIARAAHIFVRTQAMTVAGGGSYEQ